MVRFVGFTGQFGPNYVSGPFSEFGSKFWTTEPIWTVTVIWSGPLIHAQDVKRVGPAPEKLALILTNVKKKRTNAHIRVDSAKISTAITNVNVMKVGLVMELNVMMLMNVQSTLTIVQLELLVEILTEVSHVAVAQMVFS